MGLTIAVSTTALLMPVILFLDIVLRTMEQNSAQMIR